jgi:hypothetical protein
MRRALIAVPLALVVAPAANAAQIQTDRACYYAAGPKPVAVTGSGFAQNAAYSVLVDGTPLSTSGTELTSVTGDMTGQFGPPALNAGEFVRTFQLAVTTEADTASTSFEVSRFAADFRPSAGAVRRLKVRFSVYGFGLDPADPRPAVYLHWIAPRGRLRATALVGRATGPCGSIAASSKRRLFPFGGVRKGIWKLQFDTRRKFKRGRKGDNFLFYTVGVRVT